MAQVAFEEDDVRETLCEFCALLADKFDSEHWNLKERQARMWARPTAQLANSVWAKLQMILPDIFGKWCETMPGLFGFVTVGGIVMGPKLMKQVKLTRERRRSKPVIIGKPEQPQPAPQPEAPRAGGLIYKEGSV